MTPRANQDVEMGMLDQVLNLCTADMTESVQQIERDIIMTIEALAGDRKSYVRESKQVARRMVADIYSPKRVTGWAKLLPHMKIAPGFSLDLTTTNSKGQPWDFTNAERRREARELVETQAPMFIIGSPMHQVLHLAKYQQSAKDIKPSSKGNGRSQAALGIRMRTIQDTAGQQEILCTRAPSTCKLMARTVYR